MWTSFFVVYNDNVLLAARAAHCYIKYGLQKPMVKVNKLRHAELYILYSMHITCLFLTVKVVCFDRTILKILDKIKQSGYDSLTAKEKKSLFEQGKSL